MGVGNNNNLIPPVKGEVRNPKGLPKGTIHLSTRIKNMLDDDEFTTEMVQKDGKKITFKGNPANAIIKTAVLKAMSGDKQWADWIAKYGFGEKLDITTNNESLNVKPDEKLANEFANFLKSKE